MTSLLVALIAALAVQHGQPKPPALERAGEIALPGVSGRIDHMAAGAGRLYIAALGNGSVEVVDLSKLSAAGRITGLKEPQGIAVDPANHRLFVACAGDGAVHAFDTETLAERGTVKLGDDADNVRFDGRTGLLYVGYGDGALAVLNSATLELKPEIHLPAHPESFQLDPGGTRAFINTPGGVIGGGGSIVVADLDSGSVQGTWKLHEAGRNFPMALDGSRLYVGCRRPAKLLVIDTATGRTIAGLDCVGDADDVFVDAARSRVYVSGGDGELDAFTRDDADHYDRERISTAPGARTSLFVPESSRLYVAAPSGKGHPARILVYDAKGAAQPVGP